MLDQQLSHSPVVQPRFFFAVFETAYVVPYELETASLNPRWSGELFE